MLGGLLIIFLTATVGAVMAQGGSICDQSEFCTLIENQTDGKYVANGTITKLVIKAGTSYFTYWVSNDEPPQVNEDVCYKVVFSTTEVEGTVQYPLNTVEWMQKFEESNDSANSTEGCQAAECSCKDISHIQVWQSKPTAVALFDFLVDGSSSLPPYAYALAILLMLILSGLASLHRRERQKALQPAL